MPAKAMLQSLLMANLLLLASSLVAQEALRLSLQEPVGTLQLGPSMQSWCDSDGTATLEQARSADFQPLVRKQINFGYRKDACWFRVSLENATQQALPLWLQVDYAILDEVDFFLVDEQGVEAWHMGDTQPFSERPVHLRNFIVPFTLNPSSERTLYLRIFSLTSSMTVPVSLSGRDAFIEQQSNNEWLMGGFYGIALGLFFYHLVLWLRGREKTSRFYVLNVASATLYVASLQGLAQRYWFEADILPQSANHLFGYLALLSGLLFARDYLRTRQWPWLDRLLAGVAAVQGIIIVTLILTPPGTIAPLQGIVALISLALLLISGLFCLLQGRSEARIFVLAWSLFLLTVTLLALSAYGLITLPGTMNVVGVQLGLVMQQVLLSFGLAGRLRHLKRESLRKEQEVIRARTENEAKSDFLAKMSHEIRTPMNAVLGLADLLRGTRLDATQQNYVETIYNAGGSLLNVINDILDFSKISSGKLKLETDTFNLHQLLEDCLMIFHGLAEQHNVRLISDWQEDLPEWVDGDQTRLRQILLNLLSNAVKFTEHGNITLRATANGPDSEGRFTLECQVIDQGIGINREEQARLFDSFQQADSSTSRKYGGTGLGLAISRQLAELMQGRLEVRSQLGKGSTFTLQVSLTLSSRQLPAEPGNTQRDTDGLHVMVVEDNAVNQMVIRALLDKLSVKVTLASSGEEALELLSQQQLEPDLVMMDCEMPGLDGYETTRLIRRWEEKQGRTPIPILALTAHASIEHRERCFACGMNDHITKPIPLARLEQKILEWRPNPR